MGKHVNQVQAFLNMWWKLNKIVNPIIIWQSKDLSKRTFDVIIDRSVVISTRNEIFNNRNIIIYFSDYNPFKKH
jgi:hypothetical protein